MTGLANDLNSEGGSKGSFDSNSNAEGLSSGEDDFFASLISEIDDEASAASNKAKQPRSSDEDDFFASLAGNLDESPSADPAKKSPFPAVSAEDDFFTSLAGELGEALQEDSPKPSPVEPDFSSTEEDFFAALASGIEETSTKKPAKSEKGVAEGDDLDNFFAGLGAFEDSEASAPTLLSESDDFFAGLEAELESQLSIDTTQENFNSVTSDVSKDDMPEEAKKQAPAKKSKAPAAAPADIDPSNLDKCTVPVLKDMLREKGLKVTGKKAELIERLAESR